MNYEDLTFEQLRELIRNEYSELFPDDSFDSPETLLQALEDLSNHTGYKHIFNARAYRVLKAAVYLPMIFTCRDISDYSGLPLKSVQDCISIWNRYNYKYLTKLPKRTPRHENRYKLRKWGMRTYLEMKKRIKRNFCLNRGRYSPEKVSSYFVLDKYGRLMGLTEDDLPKTL